MKADAFRGDQQPMKVFLDPGHGGTDPGAIGGGYHETDLNLAVAKKVQALLVDRGYTVYMSRNNDTTVALLDRSQMANDLACRYFRKYSYITLQEQEKLLLLVLNHTTINMIQLTLQKSMLVCIIIQIE